MKTSAEFTLVKGIFETADAKDILLNLFQSKLRYHTLKNFSSEERFGKKDAHSEERIEELHRDREKVLQLIAQAAKEGVKLRVSSQIHIEPEP